MAAGIVRGQVARIHLRSTAGPAPAHTAATLSRAQSVPSQMARCEHPSRSRNDLPVPGLVMPTATARGLGATCRDMDVPHESPAPDSTDNSWIVAPEPRGVANLWRIQPSLKQTVLCQFQPERAGIVPRHVPCRIWAEPAGGVHAADMNSAPASGPAHEPQHSAVFREA